MNSGEGPDSTTPDISGEWDGVYAYGGRHQHMAMVRFGAAFTVTDQAGGFAGVITDADGVGEAGVSGTVEGPVVRFVKTYRWSRFARTSPVHYAGTFEGEGRAVQGTWQINSRFFWLIPLHSEGIWRMQRLGLPEMKIVWPPPPQTPPSQASQE